MKHPNVLLLTVAVLLAAPACTSQDSLLDAPVAGQSGQSSGGAATSGGTGGQGTGGQSTGGASATGGTSATGGASSGTGGSSGGTVGGVGGAAPGSGGSAEGGEGATGGTQSAGTGGAAGDSAGSGGSAGAPQCPDGEQWCPSCVAGGTGQCAVLCQAPCAPCAEVATEEECETRTDCHSVFVDPGTCGCAGIGCCARFERCVDGDLVDCELRNVGCDVETPFCENPAYVVSAGVAGTCYEGCVDPKDCAPKTCVAPADPEGCVCYSDADCPTRVEHCYSADCENNLLGRCGPPPVSGCFGDVDCPSGETCIGGSLSACGSLGPDSIGTCGVERCPEGDCPGASGPTCTCESSGQCVEATGPTGSGQCRLPDGTCNACRCAAPDTPIATPYGERFIADLKPGDLVYSVDGAQIRAVPIARVNRTPVVNHRVLRVTFDSGRSIQMTAGHPLADGRPLSSLSQGSELLGGTVRSVSNVPYAHDATYDILPDSTSAAYFASGVLIGSTLASPARQNTVRREILR